MTYAELYLPILSSPPLVQCSTPSMFVLHFAWFIKYRYKYICKFILYLDTTNFACTIINITWVIMWSSCWVNRHGLSSRVLSIMALYYGANIKVRVKNHHWADWLNLQKKTRHTCFSTYFRGKDITSLLNVHIFWKVKAKPYSGQITNEEVRSS